MTNDDDPAVAAAGNLRGGSAIARHPDQVRYKIPVMRANVAIGAALAAPPPARAPQGQMAGRSTAGQGGARPSRRLCSDVLAAGMAHCPAPELCAGRRLGNAGSVTAGAIGQWGRP